MTPYVKRPPAPAVAKVDTPGQGILDLQIEKQKEIGGIGMGVLSNGTPFLNQRGLARMCGVQNAHIGYITTEWQDDTKPRTLAIKTILQANHKVPDQPHLVVYHGGRRMYAYPDNICMAILEYYAFDAGINVQEEAKQRYRWLAGRSLKELIYEQLGYRKFDPVEVAWQQFQDRVSLVYDNVPPGYFCVFKEIADVLVTLINAGAAIGQSFVPDISIGAAWAKHWTTNGLEEKFGSRQKYPHHFPDYFPQAASNPQTPYCYPEDALGAFKRWLREEYLQSKLRPYLERKQRQGEISQEAFEQVSFILENHARRPQLGSN